MMKLSVCGGVLFVLAGFAWQAVGQAPVGGCSVTQPPLRSDKPNIFSDQQEKWLGDLQADEEEPGYDLVPAKDSSELDRIGQKLLAELPPTPIAYTFRAYESGQANGFSIAGGHVYISRKLITDARSEDEVAGVLSHEIGHIYTHQVAIAFTRQLKAMLGVTEVGNRDDVADKLHLLLNAPPKFRAEESEDEEEKDELLADRVGLYALIRAGYAPRALSENLDRIAANKGHTGNIFTDILGGTSEISRRVRVARKIAATLPADCGTRQPQSSAEFKSFQEAIREAPVQPLIPPSPGLNTFELDPPMRSPLSYVRFSPDGNWVLAQDEAVIHVLSRTPLKLLFSIAARGARPAQFSPDSKEVVFHFDTLRVERWDIASAKREFFQELVDYDGCSQTSLSPDGKTLVCFTRAPGGLWLKMTDTDTGNRFYDDKNFYIAQSLASQDLIQRIGDSGHVAKVSYSQDGRTMLIIAGVRSLAFDLVRRAAIKVGHDLSHLIEGQAAFVDSNKLVFRCDWDYKGESIRDTFKICETSFPDGLPLNDFKIGYQWIEPISKGNHVLIGPFKDAPAMLADPSDGKVSSSFKMDTLDVSEPYLATENERGGITVGELSGQNMSSAELPASSVLSLKAAEFSADGRFLAFSGAARSSIWDLNAQKRVALMRPFRAVRFDAQNVMHAQYTQSHQRPGQNYLIDLKTGKATEGAKFAIDQFQRGDVLVHLEALQKTGSTVENVNLQVADEESGAALWSRHYARNVPYVWHNEDGTLLLTMPVMSESAQSDIGHYKGKLIKSSDWRGEWISKGLLVEIIDSHSGETRAMIEVPERENGWGEGDSRWAALYGDFLVVHGNANNSAIYRASDGVRLGAFFGRAIAGDGNLGLLAATNRDQEVVIYDAHSGKEVKRVLVDQIPEAARFIPAKNVLHVLTAKQSVFSIELPETKRVAGVAKE